MHRFGFPEKALAGSGTGSPQQRQTRGLIVVQFELKLTLLRKITIRGIPDDRLRPKSPYNVVVQTIFGKPHSGLVTQAAPLLRTDGCTAPVPKDYSQSKPVALKPSAERTSQPDVSLVEALTRSTVYREDVRAFTQTTGLPVA
jgi:hypothetical protein